MWLMCLQRFVLEHQIAARWRRSERSWAPRNAPKTGCERCRKHRNQNPIEPLLVMICLYRLQRPRALALRTGSPRCGRARSRLRCRRTARGCGTRGHGYLAAVGDVEAMGRHAHALLDNPNQLAFKAAAQTRVQEFHVENLAALRGHLPPAHPVNPSHAIVHRSVHWRPHHLHGTRVR